MGMLPSQPVGFVKPAGVLAAQGSGFFRLASSTPQTIVPPPPLGLIRVSYSVISWEGLGTSSVNRLLGSIDLGNAPVGSGQSDLLVAGPFGPTEMLQVSLVSGPAVIVEVSWMDFDATGVVLVRQPISGDTEVIPSPIAGKTHQIFQPKPSGRDEHGWIFVNSDVISHSARVGMFDTSFKITDNLTAITPGFATERNSRGNHVIKEGQSFQVQLGEAVDTTPPIALLAYKVFDDI